MTTPTEIADLVRRTAPVGSIEEQPGHLVARAPLDDAGLRATWIALRAQPPPFVVAVSITDADVDADLEGDEVPAAGTRFRIVVQSQAVPGELRLYFAASLADSAEALAEVDHVRVADMAANDTFTTWRNRIQLWTAEPVDAFAASELLSDPRSFVTDFTSTAQAPQDLRPWLLRARPANEGQAFVAWRALAVRRLLASIADRIARTETGAFAYHFSGPPACEVTLSDDEAVALFSRLQDAAAWVYGEAREAATRHLLMANEWARTHRRARVEELGDGSLASAEAAWAAHVKSGSRETLKALAELRKAVVDEGQKAAQRTQDLASGMWKDLAVAAAPFVLKILPDAGKMTNRTLAGSMALVAAAFLVFSFATQVYINKRYFRHQKDARAVWKRALNVALTPAEVEEYSDTPIRGSLKDYRRVRLAVGVVYAALVVLLLWYAWANLSPVPSPRAEPAAATAESAEKGAAEPSKATPAQPAAPATDSSRPPPDATETQAVRRTDELKPK